MGVVYRQLEELCTAFVAGVWTPSPPRRKCCLETDGPGLELAHTQVIVVGG